MSTLTTRLFTMFNGRLIGTDGVGNRYFQEKRIRPAPFRQRRWVMYPGVAEASTIRRAWQKPHEPNLTGTPAGYRPPGSDYLGGNRPRASGDYEAWTPGD